MLRQNSEDMLDFNLERCFVLPSAPSPDYDYNEKVGKNAKQIFWEIIQAEEIATLFRLGMFSRIENEIH